MSLVTDIGVPLVLEHITMPAAMLAAMLLRRAEYMGGAPGHGRVGQPVTT